MRRILISFAEIFEVALIAVGSVFLIRNFLVQPFLVNGASMVPNFYHGDYLLVDEVTYRVRSPERGEVVVFRYPEDRNTYFIKRIIGLPGERVVIRDGRVSVYNDGSPRGAALDEGYLSAGQMTGNPVDVTLAGDEYFMLGDNRSYSFDSRNWGPLKSGDIIGLARVRLWPLNEFRAFAAPQY